MRWIRISKPVAIEDLYVRITCLYCRKEYGVHIKKPKQAKTCPCGRATFYFELMQVKNMLGFAVIWIGPFEEHREIEVDAIEVSEKEVPWQDEMQDGEV